MRKLTTILALALAASLAGCATVRAPVGGLLYTNAQASVGATSNAAGSRVGEACATSILGLVATGDASIETARRNGGITQISSIDEHATSYVGVYGKYCTIVRGK